MPWSHRHPDRQNGLLPVGDKGRGPRGIRDPPPPPPGGSSPVGPHQKKTRPPVTTRAWGRGSCPRTTAASWRPAHARPESGDTRRGSRPASSTASSAALTDRPPNSGTSATERRRLIAGHDSPLREQGRSMYRPQMLVDDVDDTPRGSLMWSAWLIRPDSNLGVCSGKDQAGIPTFEAHQERAVLAAHFHDRADPVGLIDSSAVLNDQVSDVAAHPAHLLFLWRRPPRERPTIGASAHGCQRRWPALKRQAVRP